MSQQLLSTASKHSASIYGVVDSALHTLSHSLLCSGWGPLVVVAEKAVTMMMSKITKGQLTIRTPTRTYKFPADADLDLSSPYADLKSELVVVNDAFWLRLFFMSDLGFSEAYMYGDVECEDLVPLFLMFVYNRSNLSELSSLASYIFSIPLWFTTHSRFVNSLANSRSNISAHYDISNDMFAGFLSEDMTYSCAIFDTLDADVHPRTPSKQLTNRHTNGFATTNGHINGDLKSSSTIPNGHTTPPTPSWSDSDLSSAQHRKLQHILSKLRLKPAHRLLEIGSGWGSLAILAARTTGCRVDTITLSVQQKRLAEEKIRKAGLEGKITVHLMDYRDMLPEWEGAFDRVVSIEMIEAVGLKFLKTYWSFIDWAMKKKGGVGVVQVITMPEPRFDRYMREIDFIQKWIFPGGFLPSLSILLSTLTAGSQKRLVVDSIVNIGPHYARTLREWQRRFTERFDDVIRPALRREYPEVMQGPKGGYETEVFRRKWICESLEFLLEAKSAEMFP